MSLEEETKKMYQAMCMGIPPLIPEHNYYRFDGDKGICESCENVFIDQEVSRRLKEINTDLSRLADDGGKIVTEQ